MSALSIQEPHNHSHAPNRFAVIPTVEKLAADPRFTGKGVTIAFLDSGFYPHPDLTVPTNRIVAFHDVTGDQAALADEQRVESWHWHGTQTTVAAAGNGHLSGGMYRGVASAAQLVLVKVSKQGRIADDSIARGLRWVIENRERFNIRVLNMSLGGDEDVPCSQSEIDQLAEEAIRQGIVVVVAAGNSAERAPIPPANAPAVITVGGYDDGNRLSSRDLAFYHSSFGTAADGTVKPELIAPAMWVAAPILPRTKDYLRAEALAEIVHAPDYQLPEIAQNTREFEVQSKDPLAIRAAAERLINEHKIVATHYQHVDGTSFAAPIVASVIAQMLEANPALSPALVKNILISTADRVSGGSAIRQGYGVINARRAVDVAQREMHESDKHDFAAPRIIDGKVVFSFHHHDAKDVALAGDFNNWNGAPFAKQANGFWNILIPVPAPGRYSYKFVVDGAWLEDPNNVIKIEDGFGGLNSVLHIA
ncbi:MAG TPA: S8 family serine peptidase [Pyrinomonadaceae bacterium]|nr:S8 family serine peptidase [Pyrinomonadaceae bacterium]